MTTAVRHAAQKLLIVGGVAGGASCAARARRNSELATIILFEKGPYISFANCGLPYFVGDVIKEQSKLILATPALFKTRFNIDVRLNSEVVKIDRAKREITVRDHTLSGKENEYYVAQYDTLVLSPGADPLKPKIPGIDLPGLFFLRTIPDSADIKNWIEKRSVKKAVVIGGGFIGVEMLENFVHRGVEVELIEGTDQILPSVDPEMAAPVVEKLNATPGVKVHLGQLGAGFEKNGENGIVVLTNKGLRLEAQIVILALGVRPSVQLGKDCGLEVGERGGYRVNEKMQTNDPNIYAVGDAVETIDWVTGQHTLIPLAGPANRQGRVAADAILRQDSDNMVYRGTQGTSVVGILDSVVASTGASEKTLRRAKMPYEVVYLHPNHHTSYYPGANTLHLKVIFDPKHGTIYGAQCVGENGVEKRIDVIAALMQKRGTVFDMEEAELCYAPQFGAAKDPVNLAGMIAANVVRGDQPLMGWPEALNADNMGDDVVLLDVREEGEFKAGFVRGAVNLPLSQLRKRISELDKSKMHHVYCAAGQRGYYAVRFLLLNGFKATNITGGMRTYNHYAGVPGLLPK